MGRLWPIFNRKSPGCEGFLLPFHGSEQSRLQGGREGGQECGPLAGVPGLAAQQTAGRVAFRSPGPLALRQLGHRNQIGMG